MKQFFTKKTTLGLIFALLLIGGGVTFAVARNNQDNADQASQSEEKQEDTIELDQDSPKTENDELSEANQNPGNDERPGDDEPSKTPTQIVNKPIIYTGYGHNQQKPLLLSQRTSTTCTTGPKVSCEISFKNTVTGKTISFDAKTTNNEGVALWEWSGNDVGSGTWIATAKAGDKTSDKETIYIK